MVIRAILFGIWIFGTAMAHGQISGKVRSEAGESLPGAVIMLLPDSAAILSDLDGSFRFSNLRPGKYVLEVRFLGFDVWRKALELERRPLLLDILMQSSEHTLEAIVVHADHAKQESSLATEHIFLQLRNQLRGGTFAQVIEKLPGLSAITVGTGVAKPVIRGLAFNRIIVNSQGIKQEGQQWGADHGLEIDQYEAEQVEIIKGPASLQYGSDGLGGVINILPGAIPQRNSFSGSAMALYKTNNAHYANSIFLAVNRNDYFATVRVTRQDYASFRVPTDRFVYNGFELPIYDRILLNTGGFENNLNLHLGRKTDAGISRISYSLYNLDAGLFPGAVGVPRSYNILPRANKREITFPKQAVQHHKLSLSKLWFWQENHAEFNIGYQYNLRREFSFPENHNRFLLNNPNDRLALRLDLQTLAANAHVEYRLAPEKKIVLGLNSQYQINRRSGFEFLLPDFRTMRSGVFGLAEIRLSPRLIGSGGVRADFGTNQTVFFEQPFFDSRGSLIGFQRAPETQRFFFNPSAAWGLNYEAVQDILFLKANIGKSFRVPYPNETSSDGVHHGNFRHELGNPFLKSEHGYQLDLGAEWESPHLELSLAGFLNFFDNFIYLRPSGRFIFRPDAGQTFQYVQNDAVYTGFEADAHWHFHRAWSLYGNAEYVWNRNLEEGRPLPFTPPPSARLEIQWKPAVNGWIQDLQLHLAGHRYWAKTSATVAQNEAKTPAYFLLEGGVTWQLPLGKNNMEWSLQGQNLLNRSYLNPLSRYRLINVPEQGRNLILSLKIPFFT
jgi:iron complex outermembrane receptor protein